MRQSARSAAVYFELEAGMLWLSPGRCIKPALASPYRLRPDRPLQSPSFVVDSAVALTHDSGAMDGWLLSKRKAGRWNFSEYPELYTGLDTSMFAD